MFDALRMRRSAVWLGGAATGRGLMIRLFAQSGVDPASLFTGLATAPRHMMAYKQDSPRAACRKRTRNLPDWLCAHLVDDLGADAAGGTGVQQRAGFPAGKYIEDASEAIS
jgi:16S rRNA (cytosine967-C5)-methyltransferase